MPGKDKAPLAACGPEKLRATVKASRLKCMELETKVSHLQSQIEKTFGEKDILKIMSGQNLGATPHMKFFWEQQIQLLQSKKNGTQVPSPSYKVCIVSPLQIAISLQGIKREWSSYLAQ